MLVVRIFTVVALCALLADPLHAQVVRVVRPFTTEGTIKAIRDGAIAVTDKTGKSWQMRLSTRDDGRISLGRNRSFSAPKPTVEITGSLAAEELDKGFRVRFKSYIDDKGRLSNQVAELGWMDDAGFKPGVKLDRKQKDDKGATACIVSGTVDRVSKARVVLRLPRSRYASKGKMTVPLMKDARVKVESRDLTKVQEGDRITNVSGVELNTGDLIIQKISIRLVEQRTGDKKTAKDSAPAKELDRKYEKLSDQPVAPRKVRSQHFMVHTDMSDRDAKMLLDQLEKMIRLVSRYYNRPQPGVVECYVVEDIKQWPATLFSEEIKAKIANKEGLTKSVNAVSSAGGRISRSTVYAGNDPGVVQHEAVHAYCNLTFGSTGPTWYSEGMAEMGQYWKEAQREVDVDPKVIRYIRKSKNRKTLKEIIKPGQITGDSWEAYAWRWALCHLLANNPNYNRKFKELGVGLMMKKPGVSFSAAYGRRAKQLMFEYDHFVQHVDNGYRADLCAWRWKHRFKDIQSKGHESIKVKAKAGWQPAVRVEEGIEYDYVAKGEWKLDGTGAVATADGDKERGGQLMAAVMKDFTLSEPIPLGVKGKFKSPSSGDLYLRCGEEWTRLGDNSGGMTVSLRRAPT